MPWASRLEHKHKQDHHDDTTTITHGHGHAFPATDRSDMTTTPPSMRAAAWARYPRAKELLLVRDVDLLRMALLDADEPRRIVVVRCACQAKRWRKLPSHMCMPHIQDRRSTSLH